MMKHKRPRMSIRVKIWLAIAGTAVAVVATIWLLQVVYLEDYYLKFKKNEFVSIIDSVTAAINEEGLIGSKDRLYELASENTLCIEVSRGDGRSVVKYEGLNFNCYIHKNGQRRQQFIDMAMNEQNQRVIVEVAGAGKQRSHFIGTVKGTTTTAEENIGFDDEISQIIPISNVGDYIVIVSIALAPVREASLAIRNQFLLISSIILIAATAVAILFSHWLTKNMLKVNDAAKEVAKGNLGVKLDIRSNDELGDLSESFMEMTKEISKVNVLQRELIANISHDIRTPLTMIKGYAETIKDITGDDKPTRERQLDIIVGEANRLNTLVNDVMDLSLMQAGQSPLKIESFNITARTRDILSRFELLEQTDGFEFLLNADGEFIVSADQTRIEQVLYNLINNAVNHIGEVKRITVTIERRDGEIAVSVEDTGEGIAQEDLPLIWDRYYKPYKKTERKSSGTGLGLSIVKAILINHKSHFGVTSTVGTGSRFWFTLKEGESETENPEKNA